MSVRRKIAIVAIAIAGLLGAAGATAATTGGGTVNASVPQTHYWG